MKNTIKQQYRFLNGSLYLYDRRSNAYIHCFKHAAYNTKAKAIKAFENEGMERDNNDS